MKKILIVDDETDVEPLFRQRFRRELKNGDFELNFSFSAQDAITFINGSSSAGIGLVLSDINMPGMSGLELLRKIKIHYPHINVVMVTAYGDEKNYTDAMESGASGFITKPIDFQLLKERILNL